MSHTPIGSLSIIIPAYNWERTMHWVLDEATGGKLSAMISFKEGHGWSFCGTTDRGLSGSSLRTP